MLPLPVKIFQATGEIANHPTASVTVEPGYKILCGGAQVSPLTGNFLTASYPTSIFTWTALSKDQDNPVPAAITVYAIALYDPNDQYDVQIFSATSVPSSDIATVTAPLGLSYQLVGGGAQANYSSNGQFLTTNAPLPDGSRWHARSQSHLHSDPGTVTAFAIGIRPLAGARKIFYTIRQDTTSNPQSGPEEDIGVPAGYSLIGGGASVGDVGPGHAGNLLTASYPKNTGDVMEWQVSSHDQDAADPQKITSFSLGAATET